MSGRVAFLSLDLLSLLLELLKVERLAFPPLAS